MKIGLRQISLPVWVAASLTTLLATLYFVSVPGHPPGFSIDESSICYNACIISQTGQDEYGESWPLFFRAFGEYKSPTVIYLLAALFRVTGPSIAAARIFVASFGVVAALLLGWLAWKISRRWIVAAILTGTALLTPWLFESSRLVFEVALYPALVALFLLAVWHAQERSRWRWTNILALAVTLALLTYSYSIGRLLAPLLALGLGLFLSRQRWTALLTTWILYGLLCLPVILFHRENPQALTGRFKGLTYLNDQSSFLANGKEFVRHYLANVNPARWLFTGETNIRDHLEGSGSLLAVSVLLAVAGGFLVLRFHRAHRWWWFAFYCLLISPVPASLTSNPFPQLRLIAFPMFFLVLMIPALEWLAELRGPRMRVLMFAAAILLLAGQGLLFQQRYHRQAPGLWYVFDARFPRKVLAPALGAEQRPVYLLDEPGKSGYIHALWYGVLTHLDSAAFRRLPWGTTPPPGSVVLSTEESCRDCQLIARALNHLVYSVPPASVQDHVQREPLGAFQADIVCEDAYATLAAGETKDFRFLIKNVSRVEWPCVGSAENNYAVTLQSRWIGPDGRDVAAYEVEKNLPYDIEPGDTVGLTLSIKAPPEGGTYELEVDLVQKQVARFAERGSTPYKATITVTPR